MNVKPEVLERLKQLANLVSKKGNSQKSVNDNKKEPDQKGNEDKENDTSGSGKTSGNDQSPQRQNNVANSERKKGTREKE